LPAAEIVEASRVDIAALDPVSLCREAKARKCVTEGTANNKKLLRLHKLVLPSSRIIGQHRSIKSDE
jgi:hypothetical protein